MRYLRRTYAAPEPNRELLVAALWEAGTLGVEEPGEGRDLVAWFTGAPGAVDLPAGAALVTEEWVPAADWLAGYRAAVQPLAVGERLWLDPREPAAVPGAVPAGRLPLRVPARTAFGTGSHASTRLLLRLLERSPVAGATVLDVGAGSGILALAALALGARGAWGLDVDLAAALLAGQHARLNRLGASFWAGGLDALAAGARFDLVLVNALPHEVLAEAPAIAAAVAPSGRLVVSGVPAEQEATVLAGWQSLALRLAERLAEDEWVAWVLAR
jgi:ribosomal protein L11 methyltransferase